MLAFVLTSLESQISLVPSLFPPYKLPFCTHGGVGSLPYNPPLISRPYIWPVTGSSWQDLWVILALEAVTLAQLRKVLLGPLPSSQAGTWRTGPYSALTGPQRLHRKETFVPFPCKKCHHFGAKNLFDLREILHGPHWGGVVYLLVTFLLSFFLGSAGQRYHCWFWR